MPSLVSTIPPYSLALEGTGPLSATLVFLLPLTTTKPMIPYDNEDHGEYAELEPAAACLAGALLGLLGRNLAGFFRGRRSTCLLLWLGIWVAVRPLLLAYPFDKSKDDPYPVGVAYSSRAF